MDNWNIYVLKSDADGLHYCGMTQDIDRRLHEHNSGKHKFTKGHLPWKLVYSEFIGGRTQARLREKYLKSAAGRRFLDKELGGK